MKTFPLSTEIGPAPSQRTVIPSHGAGVTPPQMITHFELLHKLGEGGMGAVFKARDIRLDRVVALKFISSRIGDSPAEHQRFQREGRALSMLSHPHVATVFEVDDAGGGPVP